MAPFHRTTEDETKSAPVTVIVKPGLPAVALTGEIEVSVSAGVAGARVAPLGPWSWSAHTSWSNPGFLPP